MAQTIQPANTPHDQPSASSVVTSPASSGINRRLSIRTSLKVTGPLLFVGACTAVALASANVAGPTSHRSTQSNNAASPTGAHVTVIQGNDKTTLQAQTTPEAASPKTIVNGSASTNGDNSVTTVTVNGQPIDVPANGSISQTVPSSNGSTSLSVSTSSNSTGGSSNNSSVSTNVNVFSHSNEANSGSSMQFNVGGGNGQ